MKHLLRRGRDDGREPGRDREPGRGPRRGRDRGGVAMITGILIGCGVLLPAGALVIDVGRIYVERGELQGGADSAALAVAKGCVAGRCNAGADLTNQRASAKKYADANAKDGHTKITTVCGNWGSLPVCPPAPTNMTACEGSVPAGNYVEVRVQTENADGSTLLPPALSRTFTGKSSYGGTSVGACARATASDVCVTAAQATYKHTFNGPAGTATITANSPLCKGEEQPFTLVSYTAPNAGFATPQYMYDYETKTITSTARSLTFKVDVPACYTQVDFVFGDKPINPITSSSALYGDAKVGSPGAPGNRSDGPDAWYNGGTRLCDPRPAVAFTSQCDGTLLVKLSNASAANIDAAFTVKAGGSSQFLRVARGGTQTVKILAGAASGVVVDDNTFDTTTGKWVKPKGC